MFIFHIKIHIVLIVIGIKAIILYTWRVDQQFSSKDPGLLVQRVEPHNLWGGYNIPKEV